MNELRKLARRKEFEIVKYEEIRMEEEIPKKIVKWQPTGRR